MTIWRMRIACWIPMKTNTLSEYAVRIVYRCNNGCTNALNVTLYLHCLSCYVLKKHFRFSTLQSTILLTQLSLYLSLDAMFSVTKVLFGRLRAKMKINLDCIVMKQRSAFLLRARYWYFKIILSKYTDRKFHVKHPHPANSWCSAVCITVSWEWGCLWRYQIECIKILR